MCESRWDFVIYRPQTGSNGVYETRPLGKYHTIRIHNECITILL